jgi:NADPH-dependent 2,4-dienoyl-CoA reductase/sulfur reductase-like enzyme/nitrite reductase/ring-hydroxylating ferredoxin subunit
MVNEKEAVVEGAAGLQDGEMMKAEVQGTDILLLRTRGELRAYSLECPHEGAKLHKGLCSGGSIICPWHHARFSAETGDLEEPPGLDALERYEVRVEREKVIVKIPGDPSGLRVPACPAPEPHADSRCFVILGGGAAGGAAAEELRRSGFKGSVVLATAEDLPPYDRTELSKGVLEEDEPRDPRVFRSREFYAGCGIELRIHAAAVSVEPGKRLITFGGEETLSYDALLLATGGVPRRLEVPGAEQEGVFLLRSTGDARRIVEASGKGRRAVVIGGGFIGMEAAASLRKRGLQVTVVIRGRTPFEGALGAEVGAALQKIHESHGVHFRCEAGIERFLGGGRVEKVRLAGGEELDADLVVTGIGVRPATDFLRNLSLMPDGGIKVDGAMRVDTMEDGSLFAAGDIAAFPDPVSRDPVRIEHWRTAEQQGRVAARNMAGGDDVFDRVPFFWSDQYDLNLGFAGFAPRWDQVILHGDPVEKDFMAYYIHEDGDRILGAAGAGRDRQMCAFAECLRLGRMPRGREICRDPIDWLARLP